MHQSEDGRKCERSGPETDSSGERELGISAVEKLLIKSNRQEHHGPEAAELRQAHTMQNQVAEVERMKLMERNHEQADGGKSPQNSVPEQRFECAPDLQSVAAPWAMFDTPQHDSRNCRGQEQNAFVHQRRPLCADDRRIVEPQPQRYLAQRRIEDYEEQEPPTGAEAFGTEEKCARVRGLSCDGKIGSGFWRGLGLLRWTALGIDLEFTHRRTFLAIFRRKLPPPW